ncbi:MAG: hypothetical protein NTY61_04025, partial [Candidatus Parcubacteria bacterium]|nr:hypothetical protein [Candidatus Parcubacteria bacterium]
MVAIFATWFLTSKSYIENLQSNKGTINTVDNAIKNQESASQENAVISPKKGDVFVLGKSSVKIQWDTSKINAYHIDFVPGEGNNDAPPYMSIYGWNPQPPLDGEYIYSYLDVQEGFMPGNYKIKLQSQDGSQTVYSDEFQVVSPVPMLPKSDKMFYIASLLNDRSPSQQYSQDDTLYVTVDTREGDGSYATPENGFALAVGIFDTDPTNGGQMTSGRSLQVISPEDNMNYDYNKHLWTVGAGPFTSLECNRWYVLRTELTCSSFDITSPCVQKY